MPYPALILVDIQNDFCPGGALEVPKGDEVVPVANKVGDIFREKEYLVVATQDWHPSDHGSFAVVQGVDPFTMGELSGAPQMLWPTHCVENTEGAKFHPDLDVVPVVFCKGMDKTVDSYSGFCDNGGKNETQLKRYLKEHETDTVFVCGLATEYCVKFTVMDAVKRGFKVYLVKDACRGLSDEDVEAALTEMREAGVGIITSDDVENILNETMGK